MPTFNDYITPETLSSLRSKSIGYMQAAGIKILNFAKDSIVVQVNEALTQGVFFGLNFVAAIVRGYVSIETSADPGDDDPFNPANVSDLPARPGYLSAKGKGDYGTERIDKTFATGTITVTNASGVSIAFLPDTLTFVRSAAAVDGTFPTYHNAADAAIYTDLGGTVTVPNGTTKDIPIRADVAGTASNAIASGVTLQTVLASGVTATNAGAVLGGDRESAPDYRARCLLAPASVSPHGPADAYRYIALSAQKDSAGNIFYFQVSGSTTGLGIDPSGNLIELPNAAGTSIGVTRVYVSIESTIGLVTVYFATAAGAPAGTETADLTVLFDAVYWPDATGRSFNNAINTSIPVNYSARIKSSKVPGGATAGTYGTPWLATHYYAIGQKVQNGTRLYIATAAGTSAGSGGPTGTGSGITDGGVTWDYVSAASANTAYTLAMFADVAAGLATCSEGIDIGGVDQTSGAGVVHTSDIQDTITDTSVTSVALGLYGVTVSVPAAAMTAILLGHVAIFASTTATITGTVTVV